jgi:hypothetical protein
MQATIMAQSDSLKHRMVGRFVNFLFNRVPAAMEFALVRGEPSSSLPHTSSVTGSASSCAAPAGAPSRKATVTMLTSGIAS